MNAARDDIDPRVQRSRAAIIRAIGELLTETGVATITAESIAARAQVSKATIYRHWRTLDELLEDALRAITSSARSDLPPTNGIDDALAALTHYASDSTVVAVHEALLHLARNSPHFRKLRAEIHDLTVADLRHSIETAVHRNELSAQIPIDEHLARLIGPLLYQTLQPKQTDTSTP